MPRKAKRKNQPNQNASAPLVAAKDRSGRFASFIYLSLLAAALIFFIIKVGAWQMLSFDLTHPQIANEWEIVGTGSHQISEKGIFMQGGQGLKLVSPGPSKTTFLGEGITWKQLPYAYVKMTKAPIPRIGKLLWLPHNQNFFIPFDIPPNAEGIVIDSQFFDLYRNKIPFDGRIQQFGFQFQEDVEIQRVVLLSFPFLRDFFPLAWREFWTSEPFLANSINMTVGTSVLGKTSVFLSGLLLTIFLVIFIVYPSHQTKRGLILAFIFLVLALDLQFSKRLLDHLRYSLERSAWHANPYDENRSRYGEEFADLAKEFTQRVPPSSKVFFPHERLMQVNGEINWVRFRFFGTYHPVDSIQESDYVFYYYPPPDMVYVPGQGQIIQLGTGAVTGTELLYERSAEAKILKVNR